MILKKKLILVVRIANTPLLLFLSLQISYTALFTNIQNPQYLTISAKTKKRKSVFASFVYTQQHFNLHTHTQFIHIFFYLFAAVSVFTSSLHFFTLSIASCSFAEISSVLSQFSMFLLIDFIG